MGARFPAIGAVLLLACLLLPAADAEGSPTLPEGVWLVEGTTRAYGRFRFFTRIDRAEDGINYTATKLNPTRYVPRDQVHFRGRFSADAFVARVQVAFPGFDRPEWRTHNFRYETGDGTAVTRLELADGPEHADAQGATTRDVWTYTPWPAGTLFLSNPSLDDRAYQRARFEVEADFRDVNRSLDRHRTERESEIPPARDLRDGVEAQADVATAKHTAYEAAWLAYAQKRAERPTDPEERIPDRPHPELQGLYTQLGRNLAEIKRLEDRIVAHQDGIQRMTAYMVTSVFSNIDSLRQSNRQIRRAIERRRRELNLPDEPAPPTPEQRRAEQRRLEIGIRPACLADILLNADGARAGATVPDSGEPDITLTVAARLKRTGMEKKLLVEQPAGQSRAKVDANLLKLVARAHELRAIFIQGGRPISEMADVAGLSSSYFTRLLRLSFLAPDITRAILGGRQPAELNAHKIMADTRLPQDWQQQRVRLGFA